MNTNPLTVLTLLRGNSMLTRGLLASFASNNLKLAEKPLLLAGCNNEEDAEAVRKAGGTVVMVDKFPGGSEIDRIEFVADLWLQLMTVADSEFIMLWDDDIIPPPTGVKRLLEVMDVAADEVAGVVSVYPFRECPEYAVLFSGEHYVPWMIKAVGLSTFEVEGGGMGFSVWRTDALRSTLPWEIILRDEKTPFGFDRDVANKLKTAGFKTLCDGLTKCRHIA